MLVFPTRPPENFNLCTSKWTFPRIPFKKKHNSIFNFDSPPQKDPHSRLPGFRRCLENPLHDLGVRRLGDKEQDLRRLERDQHEVAPRRGHARGRRPRALRAVVGLHDGQAVFVDVDPLFRSPESCVTLIFLDLSLGEPISRLLLGERFLIFYSTGTEYIRIVFA